MPTNGSDNKEQRGKLVWLFSIAACVVTGVVMIWNALGHNQVVPFAASGRITFSPSVASFPAQVVGTSADQTIDVKNLTEVPVQIEHIALSGDFQLANKSCPDSLLPGTSCAITITFTPSGVAARTGELKLFVSGQVSPHELPLIGLGTFISVSPPSLSFPAQRIGSFSAEKFATVRNTSGRAIPVGASAVGDFLIVRNGCKGSLNPRASCTVTVKFRPVAAGVRIGVLNINTPEGGNTAGSQSVGLTGIAR
jgi:hypothetical protein